MIQLGAAFNERIVKVRICVIFEVPYRVVRRLSVFVDQF